MSFLSPIFFWSFISLIPLAVIYLLKVRPRRKPTTAYFLWEDIFREKRPNRLLQRLRDFWSLLLMALAFCAVCLALTRPEFGEEQRKDVLLLIDNNASMNTTESGVTRLDRAKEVAIEVLRAFNGSQRAAVASVAGDVDYKSHLSDNPRELIEAVKSIAPTDGEFESNQFLETAKSKSSSIDSRDAAELEAGETRPSADPASEETAGNKVETGDIAKRVDWLEGQRVVLISDGCFDTSKLPERVELLKVGSTQGNVGLVSADLRRLPGGSNLLGLYVRLFSTYSDVRSVELFVYDSPDQTNLFRLIPIEVQPGLNKPQTFRLEDARPGNWRVRVDIEDALPNDNVAQLTIPPQDPIRVQVSAENRFFFENSVLAFSQGSGLLTLVTDDPDIVIDQGSWSGADRAIIFQPQGESKWWSGVGEDLESVAPKLLVEEHPIVRHIDVTSVSFAGATELTAPAKAQVLVSDADDVPLIYRVTENGKTVVVVNLDPVVAEFYFSAWFPVLVHGSATHLAGREEELLASYRPGDSIPILGADQETQTLITKPDASQIETVADRIDDIDQVGYYTMENGAGTWTVASSLLSQQESNVANDAVGDTSESIQRGWPVSHILTVLAVIVLGTESALYHRRKVG